MAIPGKNTQGMLPRIKKNVEASRAYFAKNYERFKKNKRFAFVEAMYEEDKEKLKAADIPSLNFNVTEAYISRLRGEFSIMNPAPKIEAADGDSTNPMPEILTSLYRASLSKSGAENIDNEVLKDLLGGGFSALEVYTDYEHEDTFDQMPMVRRVYDPTLCGFDPYAVLPHKGDGNYCYTLYPKRKEEFEKEFDVSTDDMSFAKSSDGFNWSYRTNKDEKVLYVCDYYEKKVKQQTLYKLTDGRTVTKSEYEEILDQAEKIMDVPPQIAVSQKDGKPMERKSSHTIIMRYQFCGDKVLSKEETDYAYLPIVYFDADSVSIDGEQIIRSYIYNAIDPQRAKNMAANSFFDEMMNLRRTRTLMSERALPDGDDLQDAWLHPERTYAALVYKDVDPETGAPIPAPQIFPNAPIPQELYASFEGLDRTIQSTLGAYDAQLGIQGNDISGKAIIAGATQANSAAKPIMINYIASMNQVLRIFVDLVPKYIVTPRTVPTIAADGTRSYQRVNDPNDPNSVDLQYEPNAFNVYIEESVSFEMQKQQALEVMTKMMSAVPALEQLMDGPGLPILLSNLDIKDSDKLQALAEKQAEAAQQQSQQPQPPNPEMIDLQLKQQSQQFDQQYKSQQLSQKDSELQVQRESNYLKYLSERQKLEAQMQQQSDESEREEARLHLAALDQAFKQYSSHRDKVHQLAKEEKSDEQKNQQQTY